MKRAAYIRLAILIFMATSWTLHRAGAATLTVASTDDNGPGSLRQAIQDAGPGDIINFSVTGSITLSSGELLLTSNVDLRGPGATTLTINGNHAGRVFGIASDTVVTIAGLTITGGSSSMGGGVFNSGVLTLMHCTISSNVALGVPGALPGGWGGDAEGAGIWNAGVLHASDCLIVGNFVRGGEGGPGSGNFGPIVGGGWGGTAAGGGVFNVGMLVMQRCVFLNNVARGGDGGAAGARAGGGAGGMAIGGAISQSGSFPAHITNCVFTANFVSGGPGGSSFALNRGGLGGSANGGAIDSASALVIVSSTFSGNSAGGGSSRMMAGAGGSGGGGAICSRGNLEAFACTWSLNSTSGGSGGGGSPFATQFISGAPGGDAHGGGILLKGGGFTARNCTFGDNVAQAGTGGQGGYGMNVAGPGGGSGGGGLAHMSALGLHLTNCTFSSNRVKGGEGGQAFFDSNSSPFGGPGGNGIGGGILVDTGDAASRSLTIAGNSAVGGDGGMGRMGFNGALGTGSGGGVFNRAGSVSVGNTLLAGNSAATAGFDFFGPSSSPGRNLIGITNGSSGWINIDLKGAADAPLAPRLGPLQYNGGAVFTMALLSGSPAIDQGLSDDLTMDQRGWPRPVDNPAIPNAMGGDGRDIGAYEVQESSAWIPSSAPNGDWAALACSADGRTIVAAIKGGPIYVSPDSGGTWNLTSAPHTNWSALACSANGSNLVATVAVFNGSLFQTGGPIYTSADAGANWTLTTAPITNWSSVACSADGSKLVAVSGGYIVYLSSAPEGPIYRSTDFGATWIPASLGDANCTSVASSADGNDVVAVSFDGPFYSSRDSGAMWQDVIPIWAYVVSVASSADGTRLLAGFWDPFHPPGTGGYFSAMISTNSGASWNYTDLYAIGRARVASSAAGERLVVAGGANGFGVGGGIFMSTNSGSTWTTNGAPQAKWSAVAISADGGKAVAAIDGGGIWTFQTTFAPRLQIAPVGTNILLSWIVPSAPIDLLEACSLDTGNWTNVTIAPALNLTNLRHEVKLPRVSNGNRFYRLRH